MKKLVLSLAVIASMSFFACGSSEKQADAADAAEPEAVEVVEEAAEVVDTVAPADTVVAVAEEATVGE